MKKSLWALAACGIMLQTSCRSHLACCVPQPPNEGALYLNITQNGQPYPNDLLDKVQMYYYYNGTKIIDPNKGPDRPSYILYDDTLLSERVMAYDSTGEYPIKSVVQSRYILYPIASKNDFYLEFPDGLVDTFSINVKTVTGKDVNTTPCRCTHQVLSLNMNGHALKSDSNQLSRYNYDNNIYNIEK